MLALTSLSGAQAKKEPPLVDYLAAGGPSPDIIWKASDYTKLKRIIEERVITLPRLQPHPTAPLFARLIAPENYEAIISRAAPLPDRLREASALSSAVGVQIVSLYLKGFRQSHLNVEDELALTLAYGLKMAAAFEQLMREMEKLPVSNDAALTAMRRQAQQEWASSAAAVLLGTADILKGPDFAARNRIRIAQAFCEMFATRSARLSTATLTDLRECLSPLVQYEEDAEVKAEIAKALDLVSFTLTGR